MSGGCPKRLEDFFSLHFTFYMSNLIIVKIKCLPEEMLVKKNDSRPYKYFHQKRRF